MSSTDLRRLKLVQDLIEKRRSQREVSEILNLSVRQVRRIQKRMLLQGPPGIAHGLRGKPSNHALPPDLKKSILELWDTKYREARLNFNHFTEKLNEIENIKISKETVRRILRNENRAIHKPRKSRKHRRHRERKTQFGALLQQDTSIHDWLSTGQKLQLIVIVDDATSSLLYCKLFEHDGTLPNMAAMKSVFMKHGLPMAAYTDRAGWFFYTPKFRTAYGPKPAFSYVDRHFETQIGRALNELGVEFIPAYSPQAKGRVERANGTLQNRLIAELKLKKITDINDANHFIEKFFIKDYNKRFSVKPADPASAFVKIANTKQLNEIMCIKFICKVAKDNTVSRAGYFKLQLEPTPKRLNWHQARVEVRMYPDGQTRILHLPNKEEIPFTVIQMRNPIEPKNKNEHSVVQKIPA